MFAALAAACAAVTGTAQAQTATTLSVDRPCYWPGQAVHFTGQGYEPGTVLMMASRHVGTDLSIIGTQEATADAAGLLDEQINAPDLSSDDVNRETILVDAYSGDADAPSAQVQFQLARFGVSVPDWDRGLLRPRRRTVFEVHGALMNIGDVVYVHYSRARRPVETMRLGRLEGPCGDVSRTMRQFPFRPRPGVYKIGFSVERRFDPRERMPGYKIRVGR
jgi:hypothetical protein